MQRSKISAQSCTNFARVIIMSRSSSSFKASTLSYVSPANDSSFLAFSHATRSFAIGRVSFFPIFTPDVFWNWSAAYFTNTLSRSPPPKCVSPAVALTSMTPYSMPNTVTSNVPPPRSKIRTFLAPSSSGVDFSRP